MTFTDTIEKELDYRAGDGIEVWLLWRQADGTVLVRVDDATSGERFEIVVGGEHALDAFHHPFAYAAWNGLEYSVSDRADCSTCRISGPAAG